MENNPTEWSTISINNINITNLYHPPTGILDTSNLLPVSTASGIYGDFNCHHKNWGYSTSDSNGKCLADWCSNHDLQVLYNPKQSATFESGRWQTSTNRDITFCTTISGNVPEREVLNRFPRSQHRPSLIKVPSLIHFCKSRPIPRWNFRKANWSKFKETAQNLAIS